VAFNIPYVYDYITKLCRTPAEVILNHVNPNVRDNGQGEATHKKNKRLTVGGAQAYDRLNKLRNNLLHKPALT
jgi:hypothetical protein